MFENLKRRSKDPSVNIVLRLMDLDGTSPKTFYIMDEIGRTQILQEYDWSGDLPEYRRTFEVLYKTEVSGRFCLIMQQLIQPQTLAQKQDNEPPLYVMEYYPGTQGRIFMKALSEENMKQVIEKYTQFRQRRLRRLPLK